MRVSLIKKDKISNLLLPSTIKGNYWITDVDKLGNTKNLICIEASNNNWKLVGNEEVSILENNNIIPYTFLLEDKFYILKTALGDNLIIYCTKTFDLSFSFYDISAYKDKEITIGNNNSNTICFSSVNVIDKHAIIKCINNNYLIEPFGVVYKNDLLISSVVPLENGDTIFIMGLKIILEIKNNIPYISVNNPLNLVRTSLTKSIDNLKEEEPFTESNEELDISLYTDDDIFHKKPRILREPETLEIKVDSPPAKQDSRERPWLLTVGPMLTMSMVSLMSAYSAINNMTVNNVSLSQCMPTLIISGAMLAGTLVWPSISRAYEKKQRAKIERIRQLKYKKYIETKRNLIAEEIVKQRNILNDNYPVPTECERIILSKMTRLWERRLGDRDFLEVSLGLGNKEMKIDIKYPEEHFTMTEDNLNNVARELGTEPKQMVDVSLPLSLVDNNIFGIVGNYNQVKNYMSQLFLQIMAFHSYDDLKIVMLTSDDKKSNWNYLKILPHIFSNDRQIRFFGTNTEEYKEIFYYLEKEYTERLDKESEKEVFKPHYLLVTDNFKLVRNFDFLKKIINIKEPNGFSLVILTEKLTNIPDQCKSFVNLYQEKAELYENKVNSKVLTFKTDLNNIYDYYKCAKILSNIHLDITSETDGELPQKVGFLEMYDVGKIEQLNVSARWKKSNPIETLSAPVGIGKSGEKIEVDTHEKYHGPHGLIAGMTGSGKSEFIITFITSMAVNYHPYEVQFILIDYKGGGLAGAFDNAEVKLPHLVGTITNLDTNEISRSLLSINSELKKRQQLFNEAREKSKESTIDIYKYQKMYREGIVTTPISHLFIISDEFAELKKEQPEFMTELISTARLGRSLGVHLILATQKPSGVVDPQIWSNTRFRVCLRVQEKSDSTEVIKKPDAALLKQTGRFYFQVGYDEIFVIGQAAWCGMTYRPSEKIRKELDTSINFINNIGAITKTIETKKEVVNTSPSLGEELINILKYIENVSKEENIHVKQLWQSRIPDVIYLNDLMKKYNYQKTMYTINPIIGELDNPSMQSKHLLTLPITIVGNSLIYGITGSGKENLLTTIIYSSMITYTTKELNYYLIDFGSESLSMFKNSPIMGDIVHNDEREKIDNLYKMLNETIEERKKLFIDYGGNYTTYIKTSGNILPLIVVIINNFEAYIETYASDEEILNILSRDGIKYGINFILTVNTPNGVRFKLKQNFNNSIVLEQNNDDDYGTILGNVRKKYPSKVFGRGIIKKDDNIYEFQTAYVTEKEQIQETVKKISYDLMEKEEKARKIPVLPEVVSYEDIKYTLGKTPNLVIGLSKENLSVVTINHIKNYVTPILSNDITKNYNIITPLINELLFLNYSNISLINTEDFTMDPLYKKYIEYIDTNYEEYIDKLYNYVVECDTKYKESGNEKSIFNNIKKHTIFILGIGELLGKLNMDSKKKLSTIFDSGKNLNILSFILIDSIDKFKKVELELWYKSVSTQSDGIWIGQGINEQFSLKISTRSPLLKEQISDNYCFVITRGVPTLVKYITKFDINLK